MRRVGLTVGLTSALVALAQTGMPAAADQSDHHGDTRVTVGSPRQTFPRNKQNEPAVGVALDSHDPMIMAAGSNDEIDNSPCKASNCSFTPGVTDNGIYFSLDGGHSWTQPTYTGWSARTGTSKVGPIGTVPWFFESGLVGDGDPAIAFGPKPGAEGFSWENGSRMYYSSLTSNFNDQKPTIVAGAEGIAVSRTDHPRAAAHGDKNAWMHPVIASKQLDKDTFSDKEAIWADNASSSQFFGNVYVCWTSFRAADSPIVVARSTDGGTTWSDPLTVFDSVSTATTGPTACTLRTDSRGTVYVLWEQQNTPAPSEEMMARSFDGGQIFEAPRKVADVIEVGKDDPVHAANGDPRFTFDGIAGARTFSGLQVDIANGAPRGRDATDQIVMTWSDGRRGLNHEQALVQTSRDGGTTWKGLMAAQAEGDRPDFPAIAISPNGRSVYLTYDAFLAPWRDTTSTSRPMQGVVRTAQIDGGTIQDFQTVHRGAIGDARASSENNLCCEFLGDYNYVSATRSFGVAVWNDVRDAQVCPAMNAYRQAFTNTPRPPKPSPLKDCPPRFGNSDIFGGVFPSANGGGGGGDTAAVAAA